MSDTFAYDDQWIPALGWDDPEAAPAHPAATSHACGAASLAPLPQVRAAGGGPESGEPAAAARPTRYNEWTRPKMVAFLRELAAGQNVSQAAKLVGMGRQSAYKLRNRLAGTPFALAWEVALETGLQQLAHALMDRVLNGEEVPHYYQGELVGTYRKYDNRLAAWLLENPGKLGREAGARPAAALEWEALLERVETDSAHWYPGETLACAPSDFAGDDDEVGEGNSGEGEGGEGAAWARCAGVPPAGRGVFAPPPTAGCVALGGARPQESSGFDGRHFWAVCRLCRPRLENSSP